MAAPYLPRKHLTQTARGDLSAQNFPRWESGVQEASECQAGLISPGVGANGITPQDGPPATADPTESLLFSYNSKRPVYVWQPG